MKVLLCGEYPLPSEKPTLAVPKVMYNLVEGFKNINSSNFEIKVLTRRQNINYDFTFSKDGVSYDYLQMSVLK